MRRRLLAVALVLAATCAPFAGCNSFEASDRPICGYRLLPKGSACALWPAPCGCADGERCGFSGDALACLPPGPKALDEACADDVQCGAGAFCYSGRCRKTCFEALDCGEDANLTCVILVDDDGHEVVGVCRRDCDVGAPSSPSEPRFEPCRPAETCLADISAGTVCSPAAASPRDVGAACTTSGQCVAGADCFANAAGKKVCQRTCWVDRAGACPSGQTCVAVDPVGEGLLTLPGGFTFGVCR